MRGDGSSVVFWHPEHDLGCVVHGDDFTFCGFQEGLNWIEEKMKEWFDIKVRARLGQDESDDKEVVIFGRTVRWRK